MSHPSRDETWKQQLEAMRPLLASRFRLLRGPARGADLATSDVVQTSIARFIAYAGRLPSIEDDHVRHLLLRILRLTAFDRFRRHRDAQQRMGSAEDASLEDACDEREAHGASRASAAEEYARLEAVLESLPAPDRELILLRRNQATWRHVAEHLGISAESARRRWSDLQRRVREQVAREE